MATLALCFPILLLLRSLTATPVTQDDLIINTSQGRVQGKFLPSLGGQVRAFLGIPYGKPPLGKLRFKPPIPVERWDGIKDATAFPKSCYQGKDTTFPGFKGAEMWNANTPLSEDCLYLNVWSPFVNKTQAGPPPLVPVLVWIYGGGFYSGTSSLDGYNGRFLTKAEGVVVVSMNYRLGPLGFLSIPDNKNIRGNAGLFDQRLALRWVANNIAAFGGDPSKVTLFGESAGSASVGFHLLSPGSQALFQRAVMQSGSPNAIWASTSQTEAGNRAHRLAKALGCPTANSAKLETCLQQADAAKMTEEQYSALEKPSLIATPFVPVVDKDFLPDTPEVLLSKGNIPKKEVLFGLNKDEGTYFPLYTVTGFDIKSQSLISRNQFLKGVALTMPDASDIMRETAILQYTEWTEENNGTANRDLLGSMVGDHLFVCPVTEFAKGYSKRGGKSYLYLFDHRSSVNPWPAWMGVMHGYEIEFVFGMPLDQSLGYTKNEVNMTKKIMKHWVNFARTGEPGIDGASWPTFSPEQQSYVTLNYNHPQHRTMMRARECQMWNKLMPSLQRLSDDLYTCVHAAGMNLCWSYSFLLISLVSVFLVF